MFTSGFFSMRARCCIKVSHFDISYSNSASGERCMHPIPYNPKFRMQLTFLAGFLNECPGAVHAKTSWSRFRNFCNAIIAILTLTKFVLCSGPLSVYKNKTGGTAFLNHDV